MSQSAILEIMPLGFPWTTFDPFLFCVYHEDFYPAGNAQMGPQASLAGRQIGQDFTLKDGWRMYHGDTVPGFPGHPHRGFETVTVVQKGFVDHADSLGAAGRYGQGDVQWLTTGAGIQHAEMFPLLQPDQPNPTELFQIWLNLPRSKKMAPPHFKMFWHEEIPVYRAAGVEIKLVAGQLEQLQALAPAPDSWAADPANEVAIWTLKLEPNTQWTLPAASAGLNRTLYFFKGSSLAVAEQQVAPLQGVKLRSEQAVLLHNGDQPAELLMLQGRPIAEPVVQYGPFVMNSQAEIQQTFADYQRNQFGGWPWPSQGPVHAREQGRFAKIAGRTEVPPGQSDAQ